MNRRNGTRRRLRWFGNLSVLSDFLDKKSWCSPWGALKLFSSFFTALGTVAFAANPLTGILIFCGMVLGNPHVAIAALMTGIIAILTCKLINAADEDVCNGVNVFNSILVGSILTTVIPPAFGVSLNCQFWIFVALAGFLTIFIDQGLQMMMAPSGLPVQSVPFNFVAAIVFLIFRSRLIGFNLEENDFEISYNNTVEWDHVLQGAIRGAGQIYGVGDIYPSILIWLGFILYSPLLAIMFFAGSYIGAALAVVFNVQPLGEIYAGLWSFNSLLASGAITFFVVPTPMGILLSIINGVIAVSVQTAITPIFVQTMIPVFSYPFNVAIMFTLAVSLRKASPLKFVTKRTFPEEHLMIHYKLLANEDVCDSKEEIEALEQG